MITLPDNLSIHLAKSEADLLAAQRLRYRVFVEELGGTGDLVDHENKFERDRFDPYFDHLVLVDKSLDERDLEHVVGVYRVLPGDRIDGPGGFYSEGEYDLTVLKESGRKLLELGRSCVSKKYRGTSAMFHLWQGLADYTRENEIEVLFGVASFHGVDPQKIAQSLSYLKYRHLAPKDICVKAQQACYQQMDLVAEDKIDRITAMKQMPSLIKSYLRLGGFVGDGAFIDYEFNTTDVCLLLDINRLDEKRSGFYKK